MRHSLPIRLVVLILSATLVLAGCKSAEERAEDRYESGLALIESGDLDRAIVEFNSVFELNPNHKEARRALADLLLTHRGNRRRAYSQYLRLAEQYPDDVEARIILSELAFESSNWEEVNRHGTRAEELAPDRPRVQAIVIARAYQTAVADTEDNAARRDQARAAERLLASLPESVVLRSILIDNALRDSEFTQALNGLDWLIERNPDEVRNWRQRLAVLAQIQDFEAIEIQLKQMIDQFPEDNSHKTSLIRFYLLQQELDKAEAFLRELAGAATGDNIGPQVDLIRFLTETRGIEAGRAEVDAALEIYPNNVQLELLRAGMDFDIGDQEEAIAALEGILAEAGDETENKAQIQVALAQMLLRTGNEVGARAQVEAALTEDPANADALKMRAAWLIEEDDTDGAVNALRAALDTEPEDAEAMTLMSQAYLRAGNQRLARDFMALAVEASGNAPAESIRYARWLIDDESYLPAEDILLPALRQDPQNLEILTLLANIYLEQEDYGRAEQVARSMRNIGTDRAILSANQLDASLINQQSGPDEAIDYLSQIANAADASVASKLALMRAHLGNGDADTALQMGRTLAEENPDSLAIKSVLATLETANGNLDTSEAIYREILESAPQQPQVWLALSRIKVRQGDPDAAESTIESGLEAVPGDPNLLWARASIAERNGDIEGAIAIYEELYERNSGSLVVANNLASLLATYRTDDASLQRAWTIAQRLRDITVPAMQDTYGWIAHRRGNSEEALSYLEDAARGLPDDPIVQYHLAEVYRALDRLPEALGKYRDAVTIAGDADTRTQISEARAQIVTLEAANQQTDQ